MRFREPRQPVSWCSWTALGLCALVLTGPGCAAIKATQQPGKKNLAVLTPGTPRTHLIAEFGAPMWSEERDGTIVDVFAFRQGYTKAVKAGRALVHGAADVATGGLWEVVGVPAESLADGKSVKVEVTYDDRRAVRAVEVLEGQDVLSPKRKLFARRQKPAPEVVPASAQQPIGVPRPEPNVVPANAPPVNARPAVVPAAAQLPAGPGPDAAQPITVVPAGG